MAPPKVAGEVELGRKQQPPPRPEERLRPGSLGEDHTGARVYRLTMAVALAGLWPLAEAGNPCHLIQGWSHDARPPFFVLLWCGCQLRATCVRYVVAISLALLMGSVVHAQRPTCILQAIGKKLVKDARTGFLKKSETDVPLMCEKSAEQRKPEAPGRNIFIAKCVKAFVAPYN